jgi:inorganic pyrophosphatase
MAEYDAVIEIPKGSRNKYEVDHETGRVWLDRVLFTSFVYPVDYGFFDQTLGGDGDPLDVLVLLEYPVFPGVGVKVRPVGVLRMSDEAGMDEKILAVPYKDPRWTHIQDLDDVPQQIRNELEHFFARYKDLEPGKWVKVEGWDGAEAAEKLVVEAQERYRGSGGHVPGN